MVNDSFTLYELWFRFVFLLLTVGVLLWFSWSLRAMPWHDWTVEQKWSILLLFSLMGFNDPFFPFSVLVDGWLDLTWTLSVPEW